MVLHFRVLKRRGAVDDALAALDDVLRAQLENMYESAETEELRETCEALSEYETRKLYKSLRKISKDLSQAEAAVSTLNEAIEKYNAYAAKFPAKIMLAILALPVEKKI
jgi:hypothetical protein